MDRILNGFHELFGAVREINEKYRHQRIQMTRMVSFWLLMLRPAFMRPPMQAMQSFLERLTR